MIVFWAFLIVVVIAMAAVLVYRRHQAEIEADITKVKGAIATAENDITKVKAKITGSKTPPKA